MYAGNIQIRGGKCLKPPKPCCDLAIKYVKKNWVFPIKIHITFVILSICIYVKIQMQQLDIATDTKHELPDVTFVSSTYIGLKSREKASIRDLMTNSSSYTRDSFLEIRQK